MSVLSEALEFLGLAEGSKVRNVRYESGMAKPRKEQRELAEAMRRPARYADGPPARTLEKIKSAAASGQWRRRRPVGHRLACRR
jgi:hypothetical protein